MKRDDLTAAILEAVKPPIPSTQWDERSQGVFSMLFGAVVSLLQCRVLLEADYNDEYGNVEWQPENIWQDLNGQLGDSELIRWDISPQFYTWSTGFFVNRARQNVAVALDRLINSLLSFKLNISLDKQDSESCMMIFFPWVGSRCHFLLDFFPPEEHLRRGLEEITKSLTPFGNTASAKACHEELVKSCHQHTLPEMLMQTRSFQPNGTSILTDSDCVAISWALNNSFKHQMRGAVQQTGHQDAVSWCVLTRALLWVGSLWQEFTTATKKSGEHQE